MDVGRVVGWYEHYAGASSAYARGDTDDPALLSDFYGVPLLISTPESLTSLASEADVLQAVRSQAEALRAAGYAESDLLTLDVTPLNATSALVQVEVSRRRSDETEMSGCDSPNSWSRRTLASASQPSRFTPTDRAGRTGSRMRERPYASTARFNGYLKQQ